MPMSDTGEKGKMSAYQRWEMASFGDERPSQVEERLLQAKLAAKASREQIARDTETAQQQGYAEGYKQGYAQGLQDGQAEGRANGKAEVDAELSVMHGLTQSFRERLAEADEVVARDVLALALELTQAMLKSSLQLQPELILPIVQEALDHLPSVQPPAHMFLNPADADTVRAMLGEELEKDGWRIVADSHMEAGGCRLETAQNIVDASAATRWHKLTDAMKKNLETRE